MCESGGTLGQARSNRNFEFGIKATSYQCEKLQSSEGVSIVHACATEKRVTEIGNEAGMLPDWSGPGGVGFAALT